MSRDSIEIITSILLQAVSAIFSIYQAALIIDKPGRAYKYLDDENERVIFIIIVFNSQVRKKNVYKKEMIFFSLVKNLFNIVMGNLFSYLLTNPSQY